MGLIFFKNSRRHCQQMCLCACLGGVGERSVIFVFERRKFKSIHQKFPRSVWKLFKFTFRSSDNLELAGWCQQSIWIYYDHKCSKNWKSFYINFKSENYINYDYGRWHRGVGYRSKVWPTVPMMRGYRWARNVVQIGLQIYIPLLSQIGFWRKADHWFRVVV